jgi:FKBP-type peptidyl-prolyl cis-trans isomerase FkpA
MTGGLPFARRGFVKLSGLSRSIVPLLAVIALAAAAAGCENTPVTPTSPEYSSTDLRVGTGTEAVSGATITVKYSGWFYDSTKSDKKGLMFDTTSGKDPFTFMLGIGSVVSGWDEGIVGMKVGGTRRLVLPPSKSYGYNRYGSIPPNMTLVFDIELTAVVLPETTTSSLQGTR